MSNTYFMTFAIHQLTRIKNRITSSLDFSKFPCYLQRNDLKSSTTISYALFLGRNFILSLFGCITLSSLATFKYTKQISTVK